MLNKSAADLPRTRQFDGIEVDEGTHERPDMPRHFAVCRSCHAREATLEAGLPSALPKNVSLADLMEAPCESTAAELTDSDGLKFCEIFDSRTSYLIHCQMHNLQFDTLRRAKHSSMMTLFHLHNQSHLINLTSCSFCQGDVPAGTGYRCETCGDVESCEACYDAGHASSHQHPLVVCSLYMLICVESK
jgi:E1A/CREB-binding protein